MGKIKQCYQEQIDNNDYYFEPEVKYYMTYAGRFSRWTPRLNTWFNKLFSSKKKRKPQYIKMKKTEITF